jgi:hypothetical protein
VILSEAGTTKAQRHEENQNYCAIVSLWFKKDLKENHEGTRSRGKSKPLCLRVFVVQKRFEGKPRRRYDMKKIKTIVSSCLCGSKKMKKF